MSSTSIPPTSESDPHRLALEKMSRILGEHRAHWLMRKFLEEGGRPLATPDHLYAFAAWLSRMDGIESAVGALLGTRAVMLGATRHDNGDCAMTIDRGR